MWEHLDPVVLARLQFAFTVTFHIVFPAFTIGLSAWLAVLEWRWLRTSDQVYEDLYRLWMKIFAVCFGMGVVSGVVLSYQLGTNWSVFSDKISNVIGPLLGYEVLTAFFLEASFLGVMLFGRGRVSKNMHFASTCIVAVGTLISAFWILAANSWMQTPQGFRVAEDGLYYATSWTEVIFNPSFPYRFAHMVTAAYLTTAFVVGGIGAVYLLRGFHKKHGQVMLGMAMVMAICVAPLQVVIGDFHGLNTLEHQPAKVAAMEGIWENEKGAALRLFAIPDAENERNSAEISIPKLSSVILTHKADGEVKGLKSWPPEERPMVGPVFYAFRVMVAIGFAMAFTGLWGGLLFLRKKLYSCTAFHYWCAAMTPAGFVAVICGWIVTEVGRQPYTVYGVLKTADSVSPVVSEQILLTLIAFIAVYAFVFGAATYYILKILRKGPEATKGEGPAYYRDMMETAMKGKNNA